MNVLTPSSVKHDAHAALKAATGARLTLTFPASTSDRDALMADFRRVRGLDLPDDDRAAKIRAAHS